MSNGVACFFEDDRVELDVAAKNYDEMHCGGGGCSNHHDCKTIIEGLSQKPTEEDGQNGSH